MSKTCLRKVNIRCRKSDYCKDMARYKQRSGKNMGKEREGAKEGRVRSAEGDGEDHMKKDKYHKYVSEENIQKKRQTNMHMYIIPPMFDLQGLSCTMLK